MIAGLLIGGGIIVLTVAGALSEHTAIGRRVTGWALRKVRGW